MRRLLRRQTLHLVRISRGPQRVPLLIRFIAVGKVIKGFTFLLGALFLARLIHAPDLAEAIATLIAHLHIDPEGTRAQKAIEWVTGLPHARLVLVAAGMSTYAAIYLIEGLGLWFDRPWAEWLTVVATALFIPFEIEHLIHRPSFGIALTLFLNLAVVGYLAWRIRVRLAQHAAHKKRPDTQTE